MCTHCRYVFNRYSRRHILVKCGKCDACKQEKAIARANRIRNNLTYGKIALFITLTYANDYVPFVYRSDLKGYGDLNVYRNSDIRYVYDRFSGYTRLKKDVGIRPIAMVNQFDIDITNKHLYNHLNGCDKDKIGVCWYPDIQDFYKRLRQILIRHYNYEKYFSYYSCSELGSHTYRPHFHALLFIDRDDEATFRSAILEAWPYADKTRTSKYIEIAKDAANYVAAYVNSNFSVLPLFESPLFKPKHSQSKDFGVVLDCFSLPSILQKIDNRDLYYYRQQQFDGSTNVSSMPIPLYVINRYFPKCKGFGWLSPCHLRSILLCPERVGDILSDFQFKAIYKREISDLYYDTISNSYISECVLRLSHFVPIHRQTKLDNPCYSFTPKDTYQIYIRLENAYQRFHRETGLSRFDYAFYYEQVYSIYHSMILKESHMDKTFNDYSDFYENAFEFFEYPDIAPTLSNLNNLQLDPNKRSDIVEKTNLFTRLYDRLDKRKKVTNYCMALNGHNV